MRVIAGGFLMACEAIDPSALAFCLRSNVP
jgi:hypothetical protein